METSSKYNVEVESILGGLESALARGQPLKNAMASFRNAGYKQENIEEAARKFQVLHRRRFHELGVDPNKPRKIGGTVSQYGNAEKEKIKKPKPKNLVQAQEREELIEQYEREKQEMEARKPVSDRKIVGKVRAGEKDSEEGKGSKGRQGSSVPGKSRKSKIKGGRGPKKKQVVSGYGDDALEATEKFRDAIEEAVQSLSQLSLPQQTSSPGSPKRQKTQVVNKISNYGMKPPTPVNKAVTFLLIFLLILLLGVLAAVFFFKEELIDLFNTFTLDYLMPLI